MSPLHKRHFNLLLAGAALLAGGGLAAAHYMKTAGHVVTGMHNQIVWGVPHVFAIFLLVAASGVLNVAALGSLFGKTLYRSHGPLSGLLAIAMLAAGLLVILLDLGRADRLIVALTHFNPSSAFAWNLILYCGFFAIVGLYLWTLMDRSMHAHAGRVGLAAFVWRLLLTTGTGMVFALLVARQAYQTVLVVPLFIGLSFAWGLAVFMLVQTTLCAFNDQPLPSAARVHLNRLLGLCVAVGGGFVLAYRLGNLLLAKQAAFEHFMLISGGIFPMLFWGGYVVLGILAPLLLLNLPAWRTRQAAASLAAGLVVLGAFCLIYVFVVGAQAFPLDLFPGMAVSSSFHDGQIGSYRPSLAEILLGLGGIGMALAITLVGVRVLDFLPRDHSVRPQP